MKKKEKIISKEEYNRGRYLDSLTPNEVRELATERVKYRGIGLVLGIYLVIALIFLSAFIYYINEGVEERTGEMGAIICENKDSGAHFATFRKESTGRTIISIECMKGIYKYEEK